MEANFSFQKKGNIRFRSVPQYGVQPLSFVNTHTSPKASRFVLVDV